MLLLGLQCGLCRFQTAPAVPPSANRPTPNASGVLSRNAVLWESGAPPGIVAGHFPITPWLLVLSETMDACEEAG